MQTPKRKLDIQKKILMIKDNILKTRSFNVTSLYGTYYIAANQKMQTYEKFQENQKKQS